MYKEKMLTDIAKIEKEDGRKAPSKPSIIYLMHKLIYA